MELTKERTGIEKRLYELTTKVVEECGYVLYDMDYITGSKTLRVFIMDPATKSAVIEDCVKVDHGFTPYMEDESADWIPDDIVLEVSSPGAFRNVRTMDHLALSVGERVALTLRKELGELVQADLDKKTVKAKKLLAILKEYDEETVTLDLDDEFELKISYKDIKKVNLEPEI